MRQITLLSLALLALALLRPAAASASECEAAKKHLRSRYTASVSASGAFSWRAAPPALRKVLGLLARKAKQKHGAKLKGKRSAYAVLKAVTCRTGPKKKSSHDSGALRPAGKKVDQEVTIVVMVPNPFGGDDYTFTFGW